MVPVFQINQTKREEDEKDREGRNTIQIKKDMAVGINAMPVTFVAHALAVIAAIMVLVWSISYRGGLAWEATNKNLIFNVCFDSLLLSFNFLSFLSPLR